MSMNPRLSARLSAPRPRFALPGFAPARFALALSALALGALVLSAPAGPLAAQETRLIDFEMEDQFENRHARSDFDGQVVVLVGSDRGGSEYNPLWAQAIQDGLAARDRLDGVAFVNVADIGGAPGFMRGMIRGMLPKDDPSVWILTDWEGEFGTAYGWESDRSNVMVFDREGALVHRASGQTPPSGAVLEIVEAVVGALEGVPAG